MPRAEGGLRWLIVLSLTGLAVAGIALLFLLNRPAAIAPISAAATPPTVLPTGRADQPSTGVVTVLAQLPGGRSTGTGIVVAEGGLVVTAYHVVQGSTSISVGTPGAGGSYSATLLGFAESHDVALLQLDGSPELAQVRAADTSALPGDPVQLLGSTSGGELRTLNGQVSAIDADLDAAVRTPWNVNPDLSGLIRTDLAVQSFDCGGPALTPRNEVIGLTVAGSIQGSSGYLTPIDTVRRVSERILAGVEGDGVRIGPVGMLGIAVAASSKGRDEPGLLVSGVSQDGPAQAVGLVRGDRLTRFGEHRITGQTDLTALIRSTEPGDEVTLEWRDAGGRMQRGTVEMGRSTVN